MQRCLPPRSPEPAPKNYGSSGLLGMVFAGLGPAAAAVFTNPFDVAKVRMQLQGEALSGGARMYAGSFDCIYKTFKAEGIAGTQRGLTASVSSLFFLSFSLSFSLSLYTQFGFF